MTATAHFRTAAARARYELLTQRLTELHRQREEARAELGYSECGDDADRATNVDAHIRLAMLEGHIEAVHRGLANNDAEPVSDPDSAVHVGDLVTVDLGDGPETYRYGSIDLADDQTDVVTPDSPLGRSLRSARVGASVTYRCGRGRRQRARLLSIG